MIPGGADRSGRGKAAGDGYDGKHHGRTTVIVGRNRHAVGLPALSLYREPALGIR